jgi:hypothetical protein
MKTFVILCALVVGACGGHDTGDIDDVIGAACSTDRDCESRCYSGGDFPGGFCSLPCASDNDCPGDTYCMSESGGVCMFACPVFDCSRLGPGWECRDENRLNGGNVSVCSGN